MQAINLIRAMIERIALRQKVSRYVLDLGLLGQRANILAG